MPKRFVARTGWNIVPLLLLSALLLARPGYAHDIARGGGRLHTWTIGGTRIDASFMAFRNSTLILERRDGEVLTANLLTLDPEDITYAYQRMAEISELNGVHRNPIEISHPATPDRGWMGWGAVALVCLMLLGFGLKKTSRFGMIPRISFAATVSLAGIFCVARGVPQSPWFSATPTDPAVIDSTFLPFKPHVATRWDGTYFYVESDGMPTQFPPMVGITNWQQQVPIPQFYTGANAWSIPLKPELADVPLSTDTQLFTGAIGVAANGIPIFNAKNNRGEDSYAIGELDQWGGHCGRADDYHYHIAPLALQRIVGNDRPIAWALDGFPVYGSLEPDGTPMKPLDAGHGHGWGNGYHYHGTLIYPYMIGAMRGRVTVSNDQIIPQPRTTGARPATDPLKGGSITDFAKCGTDHYALKYAIGGRSSWIIYKWDSLKNYTYTFVDSTGNARAETYKRK
jgi:hypothetical protein